jgi:hypothetical protein
MLVSAAVCPHPPALVPQVSQGAAAQLTDLRTACCNAVRRLRTSHPDVIVCAGPGPETGSWGPHGGGTLAPYGVEVLFGGTDDGLPLSLTIAAYLLSQADAGPSDGFHAISPAASADDCRSLGSRLAGSADRVALLVMGDGSARRTGRSPGPFDDRADVFDRAVLRALTRPDPPALLAIDAALAEELWVAGLPAWQVLAGALLDSPGDWASRMAYASAPLGVGYLVVELEMRRPSS